MSSQLAGWHPNPQFMPPASQMPPHLQAHGVHPQTRPPMGWTGAWPPAGVPVPPGYPGPPPMSGSHPAWNAGYWQYNPRAHHPQSQAWAPGPAWGFPGQQAAPVGAGYNPYKRVPRPASPSYWQTELSDNPLGLEGMVKRCVWHTPMSCCGGGQFVDVSSLGRERKSWRRREGSRQRHGYGTLQVW